MTEFQRFLESHAIERSVNLGHLNKQLEEKNTRLRQQLKEAKQKAKQRESECEEDLNALQFRLASAMAVITELRDTIKSQQRVIDAERKERCELVERHNETLLQMQFVEAMKADLEKRFNDLVDVHDESMKAFKRAVDANTALRDVNARLVEEMRRLNKQLNE